MLKVTGSELFLGSVFLINEITKDYKELLSKLQSLLKYYLPSLPRTTKALIKKANKIMHGGGKGGQFGSPNIMNHGIITVTCHYYGPPMFDNLYLR